jgi:2-polyprenyl-6-methoxyphenol hydroxylase-like FAD-dependent oxidoreductase
MYPRRLRDRCNRTCQRSATVEFSDDGEQVSVDFAVAADGVHSRVRPFVAPDVGDPSFNGLLGIVGMMGADELGGLGGKLGLHLPCVLFGANGSIGVLPSSLDGKDLEWFANLEAEDRSREEWATFGDNGQDMKDLLLQSFVHSDKIDHWPEIVKQLLRKTPPEVLANWP